MQERGGMELRVWENGVFIGLSGETYAVDCFGAREPPAEPGADDRDIWTTN